MKGSIGVPMVIEQAPRKKGVHCKYCKYHLLGGRTSPYHCWLKEKPLHYTSVCVCKDIVKDGKTERVMPHFTEEEKTKKAEYAKRYQQKNTNKITNKNKRRRKSK